MCGRYQNNKAKKLTLRERKLLSEETREQLVDSFNIAPTHTVMIMIEVGKLEPAMWSIVPPESESFTAGDAPLFNKRSEKLNSRYWKYLLSHQRCVLPMSGFYEWKKSTHTPYLLQPIEDTLFWAACLYDTWIDKGTGEMRKSFTILTMPPNSFMKTVHDRMPVLLDPKAGDVEKWLNPSFRNPEELIRQYPSHRMKKYRVSNAVGDVRNNFPGLLREIPEDPTLF